MLGLNVGKYSIAIEHLGTQFAATVVLPKDSIPDVLLFLVHHWYHPEWSGEHVFSLSIHQKRRWIFLVSLSPVPCVLWYQIGPPSVDFCKTIVESWCAKGCISVFVHCPLPQWVFDNMCLAYVIEPKELPSPRFLAFFSSIFFYKNKHISVVPQWTKQK